MRAGGTAPIRPLPTQFPGPIQYFEPVPVRGCLLWMSVTVRLPRDRCDPPPRTPSWALGPCPPASGKHPPLAPGARRAARIVRPSGRPGPTRPAREKSKVKRSPCTDERSAGAGPRRLGDRLGEGPGTGGRILVGAKCGQSRGVAGNWSRVADPAACPRCRDRREPK